MRLVVDANILFAGLIKRGKTAELLCDRNLELFVPSFIYEEYEKYRSHILEKTQHDDMEDFFERISSTLKIINPDKESFRIASTITPDIKDTLYIALAIELHCPIWSNDKRLKNLGITIFNTQELLTML
jgi:predicted nucleic acid-binding protein